MQLAQEVSGYIAGGLVGGKLGTSMGAAIAGPLGASVGLVLGGIAGSIVGEKAMVEMGDYVTGAISDLFSGITGKAVGGIARGPTTGYLEKLHGEEAVIPTVGGRVPVEVSANVIDPDDIPSLTQATMPDISIDTTPISDMLSGMLPSAISEIATLVKSDNTTIQSIKQLADTIKNLQESATLSNETQESTIAQLNTSINKLVTSSTTATETQAILFEKMISLIEELVEGDSESRRLLDDQLSTYRQMLRSVS